MIDSGLIARACAFRPWDAMSPAALAGIARRGPFRSTLETGCGGSTIVFSHVSTSHTALAIEGADRTITGLRQCTDLNNKAVTFIEGETKDTLPARVSPADVDLILLDGPHAYPMPQLEFTFLFPFLRRGGWLVLDDIQIPSVHELFRFLKSNSQVVLEEVSLRTAFFRRVSIAPPEPDGWERQGMNRNLVLRYSWRDSLRSLLLKR